MSEDDIIRMAVQCQLVTTANRDGVYMQALFDFAALVAAAERERLKQSIRHSLTIGPKTIQTRVYFGEEEVSIVKMPIEEVVAAEREACAKVCESEGSRFDASWASCAAAIRARGQS